jgi:serine/threonine protein kinase
MENELVSGQQSTWSLVKKLGEGDAGEVYLVQALVGERTGVLKRPKKSAFTGDVLRQAAQIKAEGAILKALAALNLVESGSGVKVPELLDQSRIGTDLSDRFFIVIAKAPGFDLSFLARTSRMGLPEQEENPAQLTAQESIFINAIAENGRIPDRILLNCLSSLLATLDFVHTKAVTAGATRAEGIIYNDIKPEHLFWDPGRDAICLIDWGNAQFADENGMSQDRQHSIKNDYRQFVEQMGGFLSSAAPDLRSRLEWPAQYSFDDDLFEAGGLKARIHIALDKEIERLEQARARQESLLLPGSASEDAFPQLEEVQKDLLAMGEIPDYLGASRFSGGYATRLVMAGDVSALQGLSSWAGQLPGDQADLWRMIARLAQISQRSEGESYQHFMDAVQAAVCVDWEAVLWHLTLAVQDVAEPNWWFEVVGQVRRLQLGFEADALLPLVAVNRLAFSLLAQLRQLEDKYYRPAAAARKDSPPVEEEELQRLKQIHRGLQEDIIAPWTQIDPPSPHAFLDYEDLSRQLKELGSMLQNEQQTVERLISRPKAQVKLVLDAWNRKEFATASQGLRHVLLWDPDRRRVLRADQLILAAPEWLKRVHLGPQEGENFQEFATNLEFEGRELRSHIGTAGWLDDILACLARLRKGIWPADLLASSPSTARELPWLKKFERVERLPAEVKSLEDGPAVPDLPAATITAGMREGVFGPKGEMRLLEPLDAWLPEARGSSARVYLGEQSSEKGPARQFALKLMRTDKAEYALPLFREEVQILALMDKIPGVGRMLECGFIQLEPGGALPTDADLAGLRALKGPLLRIGIDSGQYFLNLIDAHVKEGWTPYLALELQNKDDNLLLRCDAGLTNGHYLPVINLLQMAVQICDILDAAHKLNIVYRDHKILHYYWQDKSNGIFIIDWNVARLHPEGLSDYEKQMDLVQFGARGLHHILTGRSAPGALPLGPTRPEEIEQAAKSYETQWTYDDQRLTAGLRDIIEAVLAGKYNQASVLRDSLKEAYLTLPYASGIL